jgi:hypothetical protein
VISVDVSDWFKDSERPPKKPASQCTSDEVKREVWAQLRDHLPGELPEYTDVVSAFVDDSIVFQSGGAVRNDEPFFINKVSSWPLRPKAHTQIPNMFLAADYVRTATDLTTMEAANEAARRAVNAILNRESRSDYCRLFDFPEPLAPARTIDRFRYQWGLPNILDTVGPEDLEDFLAGFWI